MLPLLAVLGSQLPPPAALPPKSQSHLISFLSGISLRKEYPTLTHHRIAFLPLEHPPRSHISRSPLSCLVSSRLSLYPQGHSIHLISLPTHLLTLSFLTTNFVSIQIPSTALAPLPSSSFTHPPTHPFFLFFLPAHILPHSALSEPSESSVFHISFLFLNQGTIPPL